MHAHFVYIHTSTKGQSVRGNKKVRAAGPYVDFDYAATLFLRNRNSKDKESVKPDNQVPWHLFFSISVGTRNKNNSRLP